MSAVDTLQLRATTPTVRTTGKTNTMAEIEHVAVTGVTWTDDDGTTYRRVMTDDGIKDVEVKT